jgi:hypothetical protein
VWSWGSTLRRCGCDSSGDEGRREARWRGRRSGGAEEVMPPLLVDVYRKDGCDVRSILLQLNRRLRFGFATAPPSVPHWLVAVSESLAVPLSRRALASWFNAELRCTQISERTGSRSFLIVPTRRGPRPSRVITGCMERKLVCMVAYARVLGKRQSQSWMPACRRQTELTRFQGHLSTTRQ